MAVKGSGRTSRTVVQLARPTMRETIARLAPGTALRDGLERILRGRTGALIVIGYDDIFEAADDVPRLLSDVCEVLAPARGQGPSI